jgi:hypothetical protein
MRLPCRGHARACHARYSGTSWLDSGVSSLSSSSSGTGRLREVAHRHCDRVNAPNMAAVVCPKGHGMVQPRPSLTQATVARRGCARALSSGSLAAAKRGQPPAAAKPSHDAATAAANRPRLGQEMQRSKKATDAAPVAARGQAQGSKRADSPECALYVRGVRVLCHFLSFSFTKMYKYSCSYRYVIISLPLISLHTCIYLLYV